MAHSIVERVATFITPARLEKLDTSDIQRLINIRKNVCTRSNPCGSSLHAMCRECNTLRSKLVKQYHMHGDNINRMTPLQAQDELALRLVYEVIYDIIPFANLESGYWMSRTLRDNGHTRRMRNLVRKARRSPSKYPWLHISS